MTGTRSLGYAMRGQHVAVTRAGQTLGCVAGPAVPGPRVCGGQGEDVGRVLPGSPGWLVARSRSSQCVLHWPGEGAGTRLPGDPVLCRQLTGSSSKLGGEH